MATETAALLNPAQSGQDALAEELALSISAKQQAVVPAVPSTPAPSGPQVPTVQDTVEASARANEVRADLAAELESNMRIGNKAAEDLAESIVNRVSAEKTKAEFDGIQTIKAENAILEITEAGGGLRAQKDRAVQFRQQEEKLKKLLARKEDITDDEITGIGLIDAVINDVRSVHVDANIQAVAQTQANTIQSIQAATEISSNAVTMSNNVKKTANDATIAAKQAELTAAGNVELYNARLNQNQSNASTIQTLMASSGQEVRDQMRLMEIEGAEEGRILAQKRFKLAQEQAVYTRTLNEINIRRGNIAEKREQLALDYEGRTTDLRYKAEVAALDKLEAETDRTILALGKDSATYDADIARLQAASETAQIAVENARIELERNKDPQKEAALKANYQSAIDASTRTSLELNEFIDNTDIRKAGAQAASDSAVATAKIQELALAIQEANQNGELAKAARLGAELAREHQVTTDARTAAVTSVTDYQSFLFGKAEDPASIEQQLDSNNPVYERFRQLGAMSNAVGNFVLGATPAKAYQNLMFFESAGLVPSNDIPYVKLMRDVKRAQQAGWEDGSLTRPTDELGESIQFDTEVRKAVEAQNKEIVTGDVTNIFQPPTIPDIVKLATPADGKVRPGSFVSQPLTQILTRDGQSDTDIDAILEKGFVSIAAGELTQQELEAGIISLGQVISLYNNNKGNGPGVIGLPPEPQVNMRVRKPRGFVGTLWDDISGSIDATNAALAGGVGAATGVLAASGPAAGLAATPPGLLALGTVAVGAGGAYFASSALGGLSTSDYTILNIADPIAVRAHLLSILSSTSLGGEDTPAAMQQ